MSGPEVPEEPDVDHEKPHPVQAGALAELFQAEFDRLAERVTAGLLRCDRHYGCDGSCPPPTPPPPAPRLVRMRSWVRRRVWWPFWAAVHRVLPGECRCHYCDEADTW